MEIYIITLFVLLFFSFLELRVELSETQQKSMAVFVYCLFVFQVGLRWQTGTDWDSYYYHFLEVNTVADVYTTITGFEKGFSFLVLFIKFLFNDYTFFLVIHALLFYYFIFSAFKKFSPFLFISLLVFYATSIGVWGANRQLLALGICFYSLRYVLDKNAFKFFLLIGIAFLFHTTAILFCVFYFLNRDIKQSVLIAVLFLSFVIGKTNFPFVIFSFVGERIGGMGEAKTLAYVDEAKDEALKSQLGIIGLLKRLVFMSFFLINYKFLSSKLPYYKLIFNGFIFGLIIYFLFSSTLPIMVNRGSLYFNFLEGLLLSCQFLIFKKKSESVYLLVLLFVLSIFLLFQSISGYMDLYVPYKGIFINTEFHRFRLE